MNFSDKDPDEIELIGFDFTARLAIGESISTATFSIVVVEGADPAAIAMLLDIALIDGAIVRQKIGAGVAGVRYRISAQVGTTAGQVLVESAILLVRDIG